MKRNKLIIANFEMLILQWRFKMGSGYARLEKRGGGNPSPFFINSKHEILNSKQFRNSNDQKMKP